MTKVLIDIPEDTKGRLSFGITYKNDVEILYKALSNGIALDGLTNGEIFKVIYPNMEVYKVDEDLDEIVVKLNSTSHYRWFRLSWWNRKWGE